MYLPQFLRQNSLSLDKKYQLGDPTLPETNLGPVVSLASAERIRKQVADAGMWGTDIEGLH